MDIIIYLHPTKTIRKQAKRYLPQDLTQIIYAKRKLQNNLQLLKTNTNPENRRL